MFAIAMLFLGIVSTALLFGKLMYEADKDHQKMSADKAYYQEKFYSVCFRTQGISQVNKSPATKAGKQEASMALSYVVGTNEQVAKIGWGGSCKVQHDFDVKVGSNTLTVKGVNGRYSFTNKRGNYSGEASRRQILAMADAIRDAGEPALG